MKNILLVTVLYLLKKIGMSDEQGNYWEKVRE